MVRVGITGQQGFVGKHLYNTLGLFTDEFERIPFQKIFFDEQDRLNEFVSSCDVIVHLAAMNRHHDPEVIYRTNINLVEKLIAALERTDSKPHVIFSSSSQEERDNLYGRSKRDGRRLFKEWASKRGGKFTGLIIPNVFGPFGQPNYNSFIATFCHKLAQGEEPKIDVDGDVKLIYVGDLAAEIIAQIRNNVGINRLLVPHRFEYKVSAVLNLLKEYQKNYIEKGIIPLLDSSFKVQLFNTLRSYIDLNSYFPVKFTKHSDPRGVFVEVIRLNVGGQVSFSTTASGITRGNHFHTRKIERFAVIRGKALIQLRQIGTNEVLNFNLDGNDPSYVDMPVWYTHNIKNVGDEELLTIFWINEFYDPGDADTYFETV